MKIIKNSIMERIRRTMMLVSGNYPEMLKDT